MPSKTTTTIIPTSAWKRRYLSRWRNFIAYTTKEKKNGNSHVSLLPICTYMIIMPKAYYCTQTEGDEERNFLFMCIWYALYHIFLRTQRILLYMFQLCLLSKKKNNGFVPLSTQLASRHLLLQILKLLIFLLLLGGVSIFVREKWINFFKSRR